MVVRIFLFFSLGLGSLCQAQVAEGRFLDVVRTASERKQEREAKAQSELLKVDPQSVDIQEEKAVILLSRGLSLSEQNPEQAKANFEAAQKILSATSPLYGLVSIYNGRVSLKPENARAILAKLNALTKGNINKSPMWRPEKYALMIEILMILEKDRLLARTWSDMMSKVKLAFRDPSISQKMISYLERRGLNRRAELWPIVESMATEYPHSESGRWAFQKLQELSCQKESPYIYSLSLISRLSSNLNLDEGLKYFLIQLTTGPVRLNSGRVSRLDEFERINFLFQNRFWNEARRLVEDRVEELKIRQNSNGRIMYAKALNLLGQIQVRQADYEPAMRTWSLYVEEFKDIVDTRPALENLADSLSRLRHHRQAAKIYEYLAKSSNVDPVIKWHHFWNLYLADDLAAAIDLLDKGGYVPHRDRGIEGGLDYWRARILEKQNKRDEADAIYKKILTKNGESFYSILIKARHPGLFESTRRNIDPNVRLAQANPSLDRNEGYLTTSNINIDQLNGGTTESLEGIPNVLRAQSKNNSGSITQESQAQIRAAKALGKWGQPQLARRILRLVPSAQKKGGEGSWVASFRLALDLKDYSYGFKSTQMTDSPLRQIPYSASELEVHMLRFNSDWKLLYPYAYRDVIDPVASAAGVDPLLILSLMRVESVYDVDAQSYVGARGLMQIMPFTAIRLARIMQDSQFEPTSLAEPEINIGYGSYYLRKLADYYKGNMLLAVAAYNGGPSSVDRWLTNFGNLEMDELIETMSFRETRRYVKSVYKNLAYYKFIWQQTPALASMPKVPDQTTGDEIF